MDFQRVLSLCYYWCCSSCWPRCSLQLVMLPKPKGILILTIIYGGPFFFFLQTWDTEKIERTWRELSRRILLEDNNST
ncbi:unnamed protein product [Linum tenue]|uniref:Uncharacterized protein n=1 Tax=Linum tenue TaxID=586396 RepID=A0AAV0ITF0_9ROSI|nr:unnamed protein product [Linum tenue]